MSQTKNAYTCAECGGEAIIGHGQEPERVCSRCFRKRPAKPPCFSQEDKLAWAADIKAKAFELYDLAAACPHGHPRNVECEHCWIVHNTVATLEEFVNRETARIYRERVKQAPGADVGTQRLTQS